MAESPRATELRREIAEMKAHADHLDPAMTATMLASLEEDLAEALAEGHVEPRPTAPRPMPKGPGFSRRRPSCADLDAQGIARPGAAPTPEPTPAAPAAQEKPMPKKYDPQQKCDALLGRLKAARKAGKPYHKLAHALRAHCAEQGLPLPDEARLRNHPRTAAKAPATAPHASASPAASAAHRAEAPRAQGAAQPPAQGAGEPQAPASIPLAHTPAAARIRALRSQALDLLPDLEDLEQDAAKAAHEEMDLLAEALVLGGKLIARRTA